MSEIKDLVKQLYLKTQINFDEETVTEELNNSYAVFMKNNTEVENKKMLEKIFSSSVMNNAEKIIDLRTGRIDKKILNAVQADVDRKIEQYKSEIEKTSQKERTEENLKETRLPGPEKFEENKKIFEKLYEENPDVAKKVASKLFSEMSDEDKKKTFSCMFNSLLEEIPEAEYFIKGMADCFYEDNGIKIKVEELMKNLEECSTKIPQEKLERILEEIEKNIKIKIKYKDGKFDIYIPEEINVNDVKQDELETTTQEDIVPETTIQANEDIDKTQSKGNFEDIEYSPQLLSNEEYKKIGSYGDGGLQWSDKSINKDVSLSLELNQVAYTNFAAQAVTLQRIDLSSYIEGIKKDNTVKETNHCPNDAIKKVVETSIGSQNNNSMQVEDMYLDNRFILSKDKIEESLLEEPRDTGIDYGSFLSVRQKTVEEMKKIVLIRGSYRKMEEGIHYLSDLNSEREEKSEEDKRKDTPSDEEK